ncbi:hypothetical protein GCM10020229_33890 [Kitasatospora albolonga]|uniref:hypothetical protein n=1 Tax=Kitasatospora albolonga TaxID=68173 RepID=UPI0031EB3E53
MPGEQSAQWRPAPAAAPRGGSAATADPLPSTAGPATIPGPRVRRVGLLLHWYPYVRAEQLLRRARRCATRRSPRPWPRSRWPGAGC